MNQTIIYVHYDFQKFGYQRSILTGYAFKRTQFNWLRFRIHQFNTNIYQARLGYKVVYGRKSRKESWWINIAENHSIE